MEFLKNNARGLVIALLAVGAITAISVAGSSNDEQTTEPEASQTETADEQVNESTEAEQSAESESTEEPSAFNEEGERESAPVDANEGTFTTTARRGDNQTTLMRDIIAQSTDASDVTLSAEQMLYVETNLVQNLPASDLIFVGDTVSVSEADVQSTIEAAQNLSDSEIALWSQYL